MGFRSSLAETISPQPDHRNSNTFMGDYLGTVGVVVIY